MFSRNDCWQVQKHSLDATIHFPIHSRNLLFFVQDNLLKGQTQIINHEKAPKCKRGKGQTAREHKGRCDQILDKHQ